ncbi:hypothetical protein C8Q75DRAFT_888171 [Abortiporus biennis]|nr:hypothetical protein C8Q75DRAFT_888171 [Abortiporus biennis]
MPLIVPALRAIYVFSNIFETFKTLKMPPPSARNGGQPTVRALSQRKRAMKGVMTVWLVWVCFMVYERTIDGIISIFIPFYNEFKALVLVFFMLTRAKGAEPVYLHILRPLVKPYVTTLDALLEYVHSFGDFALLVASIPIGYVVGTYRRLTGTAGPEPVSQQSVESRGRPSLHQRAQTEPTETEHGATRTRRRPLEAARARSQSRGRSAANGNGNGNLEKHEIWYPPPSAYTSEDSMPPSSANENGLPTPPVSSNSLQGKTPTSALTAETLQSDSEEWRQYEAFPSAYPPTPAHATSSLPSMGAHMTEIVEEVEVEMDAESVKVVEEWRKYEDFPSAYPNTPMVTRSKLPKLNGESNRMGGIEEGEEDGDEDVEEEEGGEEMDVDSDGEYEPEEEVEGLEEHVDYDDEDYEEDEDTTDDDDVFNTTPLRTPYRPPRRVARGTSSSTIESNASGLSTTDAGLDFPLTRTSSETSKLSSNSGGKKRVVGGGVKKPLAQQTRQQRQNVPSGGLSESSTSTLAGSSASETVREDDDEESVKKQKLDGEGGVVKKTLKLPPSAKNGPKVSAAVRAGNTVKPLKNTKKIAEEGTTRAPGAKKVANGGGLKPNGAARRGVKKAPGPGPQVKHAKTASASSTKRETGK